MVKDFLMILLGIAGLVTLGYTIFFWLLMGSGLGSNWSSPGIPSEGWAILFIMATTGVVMVWISIKYLINIYTLGKVMMVIAMALVISIVVPGVIGSGIQLWKNIEEKRKETAFLNEAEQSDHLSAAYYLLIDKNGSLEAFLDTSRNIAKKIKKTDSSYQFAYTYAMYFNKLVIKYNVAHDYKAAKALILTYVKNIAPVVGMDRPGMTENFVSQALVTAIFTHDDEISELLFKNILGDKYNIADENNGLLAFNLACYYSRQHLKTKMLSAVRRALQLGKQKSEFVSDNDFADYLGDPDFQAIF